MENEIIRSIKNGKAYVDAKIAKFLLDKNNAVFFIPDDESNCLFLVEKHLAYIKEEKKLKSVLFLLPKELSAFSLGNEDKIYLTSQEIQDLYCLAIQSRIAENFYLLSFKEVPGREYPASIDKETMLLNGVLCISA